MREAVFAFAKIQSHPVECMLATTVALGSFSAAVILLSPSTIIFSLDFAAERFFTCVS